MTLPAAPGPVRWVADMAALDALHAQLDALWAAHPEVAEADRMALALALAELAANVVEHGAAAHIWFWAEPQADGGVLAVIADDGPPMPRRVRSTVVSDDPLAESGRGMALARHLTQLSYVREAGRNRWRVLRPPGGPDGVGGA